MLRDPEVDGEAGESTITPCSLQGSQYVAPLGREAGYFSWGVGEPEDRELDALCSNGTMSSSLGGPCRLLFVVGSRM